MLKMIRNYRRADLIQTLINYKLNLQTPITLASKQNNNHNKVVEERYQKKLKRTIRSINRTTNK